MIQMVVKRVVDQGGNLPSPLSLSAAVEPFDTFFSSPDPHLLSKSPCGPLLSNPLIVPPYAAAGGNLTFVLFPLLFSPFL